MNEYRLIFQGDNYIGNRYDIINSIATFRFNGDRRLVYEFKNCLETVSPCSWNETYSNSELKEEAYRYLWEKVTKGKMLFKRVQ